MRRVGVVRRSVADNTWRRARERRDRDRDHDDDDDDGRNKHNKVIITFGATQYAFLLLLLLLLCRPFFFFVLPCRSTTRLFDPENNNKRLRTRKTTPRAVYYVSVTLPPR